MKKNTVIRYGIVSFMSILLVVGLIAGGHAFIRRVEGVEFEKMCSNLQGKPYSFSLLQSLEGSFFVSQPPPVDSAKSNILVDLKKTDETILQGQLSEDSNNLMNGYLRIYDNTMDDSWICIIQVDKSLIVSTTTHYSD